LGRGRTASEHDEGSPEQGAHERSHTVGSPWVSCPGAAAAAPLGRIVTGSQRDSTPGTD
jgi:hypothetical protein